MLCWNLAGCIRRFNALRLAVRLLGRVILRTISPRRVASCSCRELVRLTRLVTVASAAFDICLMAGVVFMQN